MTRFTILLGFFIAICATTQAQFQQGIKADYYNGLNFNSFVRTRIEKNIGFSRKLKSPAPGVGKEFFSIRYTGSLHAPKTGLYTFYVLVDDGVRVRINHQLIIDAWVDQEATSYSGSIMLTEGEHYDIHIEYYNSIVHSVFSIRWELPMDSYDLFSLGRQSIITPIPATALTPTRSEPRQRTTLLVGTKAQREILSSQQAVPGPGTVKKTSAKPRSGTIVENEPIILRTVVFDQQSAVLKDGAARELDHLVKYLKTFNSKKIEISGYTDYLGDSLDNQVLSEQRAKTIALYLIKAGIEES
ncbi:MAG TPA: PA14 domain-containing protein, partial [Sphingobacteriaceae bacterium]